MATACFLVVLVLAAVGLLVAQRRVLTSHLDEGLLRTTDELARDQRGGGIGLGDEDAVAQVVARDGTVIWSSANLAGEPPLLSLPKAEREFRTTANIAADEARYRMLVRRVDDVTVIAGTPIDDVEDSVSALRRGLIVAIPLVAAVLGLVVWWLIGRTLQPVEAIRAQVAGIGGANLDQRVPEPDTRDEISRLAHTMNAMLERLERAAEQQRRFVADASHELRSPLARMRTELEVDIEHPATADAVTTQRSLLEETRSLQRMVDDLLVLAREDANADVGVTMPVDLDDIVLRETEQIRADGRISVDIAGVSAAQVLGDREQLTRVLRNLFDNAVRHARSAITVTAREHDALVEITIADDGAGIPQNQVEAVFERFTRLDDARTSEDGGTGLGLAIARDIATRHGGTLNIDPNHGAGARFVLTLPAITHGPN